MLSRVKRATLPIAKNSIQNLWIGFAALLAGCASGPIRNSPGFVDDIARHADSHRGQLLASGGPLLGVRPEGNGAVLRIATPNYGHLFDVRFPRDPGTLRVGNEVSFLGTLQGTASAREAYSGQVIEIDGVAIKPIGSPAVMVAGQEGLARSWLSGSLDLTAGAPAAAVASVTDPSRGQRPRPQASPQAAPAAQVPTPASAAGAPTGPATGSDAAVDEMLQRWNSLSDSERADFLRRAGISR